MYNKIKIITLLIILNCNLLAINNFKVAIDIGHTPKRSGATSASGIKEYLFNKILAFELLYALKDKGYYKSFIINEGGDEIKLINRAKIANDKNADLFISIHHDSVQSKFLKRVTIDEVTYKYCNKFEGYSLFYSKKNRQKKKAITYAKLLADKLMEYGLNPTLHHAQKIKGENREVLDKKRGIYQFANLVVLKKTNMPSILLEAGIIVNTYEEEKLSNVEYRRVIILAIINSIEEYEKNK